MLKMNKISNRNETFYKQKMNIETKLTKPELTFKVDFPLSKKSIFTLIQNLYSLKCFATKQRIILIWFQWHNIV